MTDEELYTATYCENCGQLFDASEDIHDAVDEPVHRVELIEAVGDFDNVTETTAEEFRECECTGQVVQRYYIKNPADLPEPEYEPDPEEISGRAPDEDALIDFGPVGGDVQEAREVPWLEEGNDD